MTKHPEWTFKTVEEISTPPAGISTCTVYANAWWLVDTEGRVAIYGRASAQANLSVFNARMFANSIPWAVDVVQIPVAYVRHECERY